MNCHEVQTSLSLYLYGELDFATEEHLEQHLATCAFCQTALAREKSWHTGVNAGRLDPALDLLSQCRRDLRTALSSDPVRRPAATHWTWSWPLAFSPTRWSMRVAAASFLVFIGFSAAHWIDRNGIPSGSSVGGATEMGIIDPTTARVRDIQPGDNNHIRIVIDQVRQREITGSINDDSVRRWLLVGMQDSDDPGIRIDSVEMLQGHVGDDVREALLRSVRGDPNAAVRLKALTALRPFRAEPRTRGTLEFVLQHDTNAAVRSEAIDMLAPPDAGVEWSPDLADSLQQAMRVQPGDEYVHMRCRQLLDEMRASLGVY
jgi:hypothetical protein